MNAKGQQRRKAVAKRALLLSQGFWMERIACRVSINRARNLEPSLIGASWVKLLPRLRDHSHGSLASLRGRRLAAA